MPTSTLSRRSFASLLASAATLAAVPAGALAAAATEPTTPFRLSANENPYGPSPASLEAMRRAFDVAYRYPDSAQDELVDALAKLHGVSSSQIVLGSGSNEILKLVAASYLDASKTLAMAAPSFEALYFYALAAGAKVVKVPLDARYAHDAAKLAATNASVIYVCNPNNPTGSITPKADVRALLDAAPASVIVVDEAYHHYADAPDYESVVPLVATHPNLVVTRTFSKVYALAGLRCGYAVAQPKVIDALQRQQAFDSLNIMALVAARAALPDTRHVAEGRRRNLETRNAVVRRMRELGFDVIPSQANFIMIDVRRDVKPLIGAMRDRGVEVGRLFPALPHHMRVTIGTPKQMERFVEAFRAVVG